MQSNMKMWRYVKDLIREIIERLNLLKLEQ